jgi:hypothetical protein
MDLKKQFVLAISLRSDAWPDSTAQGKSLRLEVERAFAEKVLARL